MARKRLLLLAGVLLAVAVIMGGRGAKPSGKDEPLVAAAAASLRFALAEIGPLYEARSGSRVTFVYGASGDLARQVAAGAPVDLFLSASREFVDELAGSGHIVPGSETVFAGGTIALAVNRRSGVEVDDLTVLLTPAVERIAIANPDHAPYGQAAKRALEAAGLWDQLQEKIVYGENVTQALQFVQTGNAPVGILPPAWDDTTGLDYREIDPALYAPLEHLLGVVTGSPRSAAAGEFAAFLLSSEAAAVFKKHGFTTPQGALD